MIKVATGFASNTAVGLSTGDGATIVLDPRTGHLQTVLMDRGWLTDVRTAAAVAVACRHLTRTAPAGWQYGAPEYRPSSQCGLWTR